MRLSKMLRKFIDSNNDRDTEFARILNVLRHVVTPCFDEINILHTIYIRYWQTWSHLSVSKFYEQQGLPLVRLRAFSTLEPLQPRQRSLGPKNLFYI